jgi:hypothetical protein
METIEVRELVINPAPGKSGIDTVAVVDRAAIMELLTKFKEQKEVKTFFASEDFNYIISPALIPDRRIPRIDEATGEKFAVFMSRETIFNIGKRWMREGRQNFANEMHDGKQVDGVNWYSAFFSDEKFISNPKGYEHLPMGTWYLMAEITNKEIKQKIQDGTYTGISIEGMFDMVYRTEMNEEQLDAMCYDLLSE